MEQKTPPYILGIVPGRRVVGFGVLNDSGLQLFGVKSLRRQKTDSDKLLVVNRFFCKLASSFPPRAIVTLKLSAPKATDFNAQVVTFIRGLATSRSCPLYSLSLKQIKTVLGTVNPIKNHRQLAQNLSASYHELAHYLPKTDSAVIKDREKYYQPLFAAVGLAVSYLKLAKNDHQTNPDKPQTA
jgi:hypothetical protein